MKRVGKILLKIVIALGLLYLLFLVIIFTTLKATGRWEDANKKPPAQLYIKPTVSELFNAVNAERAKVGVKPLAIDPALNVTAQIKADDMHRTGLLAHKDADGKSGNSYITDAGIKCYWQSENLSWKNHDINAIMRWWIDSPAHYNAMISPEYDTTGFGISEENIVVQHFCDNSR